MATWCNDLQRSVKGMIDTFLSRYPVFISHVLNGFGLGQPCYIYSCSTIRDVDALRAILRGMEVRLDNINVVFPQWEATRKDTMDHLIMYADELDVHHRHSNYGALTGSLAGLVGGGLGIAGLLAAAPTAGASLVLVGAGGALNLGASVAYMGIDEVTKRRVKEHVTRDEQLTRQLAVELEHLDQFVGRLGRWISFTVAPNMPRSPMISSNTAMCLNTALSSGMKWRSVITGTEAMEAVATGTANGAGEVGNMVATGTANGAGEAGNAVATGATNGATGVAETGANIALRNSAIALIGVGMLLDVAAIAYVANDIRNGSKTATGQQLRQTAAILTEELEQVRRIYLKIRAEGERQEDQRLIRAQQQALAAKDAELLRLRAMLAQTQYARYA